MDPRLFSRPWFSVALATALLIGGGAAYRVVASRLSRPSESTPLPPGTLDRLPLQVGDWIGREVPLEQAVVRATDTDQHVSRHYARIGGSESVSLFVAYGVRARDLAPHRPEVCYPGAGWTFSGSQDVNLPLADGSTLPCRILRFDRGGLVNRRITVLNYYVVDGECSPDVELLRSKIWRPATGVNYVAQVQITCSGSMLRESAEGPVKAFAAVCAGPIRVLMPDAPLGLDEED